MQSTPPTPLRWRALMLLSLFATSIEAKGAADITRRARATGSLAKTLASLFMVKEGDVTQAKNSMDIFQAITSEHVRINGDHIKAKQLERYAENQIRAPTVDYLKETLTQHLQGLTPNLSMIANAMEPNLAYFTDPSQNFVSDFFQALTPAGTSLGSVQGPDFIDSAPCLIGTAATGVSVTPAAINIIPQLFSITPSGVAIAPQGINIQPSVVYISPYGSNVSPLGINIQPILINIAPILDSVSPQGVAVTPTLITVGSSGPAASPSGSPSGGSSASPSGGSETAVASAAGRKLLAAEADNFKEPSYGDIFLQSYEKWVQVVASMVLAREATPQDANSLLTEVHQKTRLHLDMFGRFLDFAKGLSAKGGVLNATQDWEDSVDEFSQLYPVQILEAALNGSLKDPNFDISSLLPSGVSFQDPDFFDDQGSNVSSTLQGFSVASAFINYAPCLIANAPAGIAVSPSGINIQPNERDVSMREWKAEVGIVVTPQGVNIQPEGINVAPTLIFISPVGSSITPTGLNIGPSLINVQPIFHMTGDAAVTVGDSFISVDNSGAATIAGSPAPNSPASGSEGQTAVAATG